MNQKGKLISVVIPVYNEGKGLTKISERIIQVFNRLPDYDFEIIFVDDGSIDESLQEIIALNTKDKRIQYLSFSRNFGHQMAVKAGIDNARGMCVISIDADLQHPPDLIEEMLQKWEDGYEIVYTRRKYDKNIPYLKRKASVAFYRFLNFLSDIEIEQGAADFRLLDRQVVDVLRNLSERNLFLRGLVKWMGYRQYGIDYQPGAREFGKTKYNMRKMISLAINGITSFSIRPLRIAGFVGMVASGIGFTYALFAFYAYFFTDLNLTGWTSLIMAVIFFGGVQLLTLGIIGEYIGKLFMQAKGRPNYIIKKSSLND